MSIKSKVFAATATLTLMGGLSVVGLLPADAAVLGGGQHMTTSSQHYGRSGTSPCGSQGENRQGENRQGENRQGENRQGERGWSSSYHQVQYQQSYGGEFYRGRQGQHGGQQLHGLRGSGPC